MNGRMHYSKMKHRIPAVQYDQGDVTDNLAALTNLVTFISAVTTADKGLMISVVKRHSNRIKIGARQAVKIFKYITAET